MKTTNKKLSWYFDMEQSSKPVKTSYIMVSHIFSTWRSKMVKYIERIMEFMIIEATNVVYTTHYVIPNSNLSW